MARSVTGEELSRGRENGAYTIGQAAKISGVSAKMIRHYEQVGLMSKARRTAGDYRLYTHRDLHALRFIRRARDLGFSIKEIQGLLNLWRNQRRTSAEVKRLAVKHLEELEQKITALQGMRAALVKLAANCHGDSRPDCPILDDLEGLPDIGK